MFEQTKALCQKFLDMGIPCFDLIVYKDGQCVLLSPNRALRAWLYYTIRADLLGEQVHIPNVELNYDPSITY